jgi:uncharacterized protein with NRDE domain
MREVIVYVAEVIRRSTLRIRGKFRDNAAALSTERTAMCLIACAWRADPRFDLLLVANRDEFHDRPSLAAAPQDDASWVIGGVDQRAGGSWLQFSTHGRLAAVTNLRLGGPAPECPRSRGALVAAFVRDLMPADRFARDIEPSASMYGRFNLLMWDGADLRLATNHPGFGQIGLLPGLHVLSNGPYGTPWPKTERLRAGLRGWLDDPPPLDGGTGFERLFALLADRSRPDDDALPETGVGLEIERLLAPVFIADARYGTRCSTAVAVAADGRWWFEERRFAADGLQAGTTALSGGPEPR